MEKWKIGIAMLTVALALTPNLALAYDADPIIGIASVIDGDTIEIHGTRIRLHGIDAPESSQLCERPTGENWRCGQSAALELASAIGEAPISCQPTDVDRYGRTVAVCSTAGRDINAWMVIQGWAVAYRQYADDYVPQEKEAQSAGRGIWSGTFMMPWEWRRGTRSHEVPPTRESGEGCSIKGNISSKGRHIYHVPGGRWYAETRIDASKGERWFCTEQEAISAGWRRSNQ